MPEPTTPEQLSEWQAWLAERPDNVREIAEQYPPWPTYRLKSTGQHCAIRVYDEHDDGRVTVKITAWYEPMIMPPRGVFGVDPHDLERVGA